MVTHALQECAKVELSLWMCHESEIGVDGSLATLSAIDQNSNE
jgi:ABC-type transporter Mla maintaining outer membrane lipid asymmetry ATPase subunit MlaF